MENQTQKMTAQETFDKIVSGVIAQGRPAIINVNGTFRCRYRAGAIENGERIVLKCAVGQIIPDAEYNSDMEIFDVTSVSEKISHLFDLPSFGALRDSLPDHDDRKEMSDENMLIDFLELMRLAHDSRKELSGDEFVKGFKANVRNVVAVFGLNTQVCNNE